MQSWEVRQWGLCPGVLSQTGWQSRSTWQPLHWQSGTCLNNCVSKTHIPPYSASKKKKRATVSLSLGVSPQNFKRSVWDRAYRRCIVRNFTPIGVCVRACVCDNKLRKNNLRDRRAEVGVVKENDVQWDDGDLVNAMTLQWRQSCRRPISDVAVNSLGNVGSRLLVAQQVLQFTFSTNSHIYSAKMQKCWSVIMPP